MTTTPPRRLGRGLSSLLGSTVVVSGAETSQAPPPGEVSGRRVHVIAREAIVPGRFQPRRRFDEASLAGLAESIRTAGVMQPILVRRLAGQTPERYELVAGERRWRAAALAGLDELPAIVVDLTDADAAQWALIENLQREDLGTMERAQALAALASRFELPHAEIGRRVGLDRSSVTNLIRLVELEPEIQGLIEASRLSAGHGKALLTSPPGQMRVKLAERAAVGGWSVRRLEQVAGATAAADAVGGMPALAPPTADEMIVAQARALTIREIERRLSEHLGTRVSIRTDRTGTRGRVMLRFYGVDQFDGMLRKIGINPNQ